MHKYSQKILQTIEFIGICNNNNFNCSINFHIDKNRTYRLHNLHKDIIIIILWEETLSHYGPKESPSPGNSALL